LRKTHVATATGVIEFNELGEIKKNVQAQVIKDGKFHHFAVIDDPVLLAPPNK
jgi:branched-chain amino acid transport system substrate-binding protein